MGRSPGFAMGTCPSSPTPRGGGMGKNPQPWSVPAPEASGRGQAGGPAGGVAGQEGEREGCAPDPAEQGPLALHEAGDRGTRADAELRHRPRDVLLDRLRAEEELRRNLA